MELQRPHQLRDGAGVLAVGTIVGMMGAALAISFAALIFTGDMAEFLPIGAGMALAGAALSGLVIAVIGGLPGTIAGAQDNTAVIMALAVAGATGAVAGPDRLPTALAVIVSGTVLTGVAMLTIGRFHLGRFVRYVPYPVIGGFLAGTGWLITIGGLNLLGWTSELPLQSIRSPNAAMGVGFAVGLLALARLVRRPLAVPALMVLWTLGFHVVRLITDTSLERAAQLSWVIGGGNLSMKWSPTIVTEVANADWSAVLGQATTIATAVVLAIIALLLYISALELIADRSIDMDHELATGGLANLAGAAAGGVIAYHYVSLTAAAMRMSAPRRSIAVVASLAQVVVLLGGVAVLRWMPTSLAGGLLLYLGLDLMIFWVIESRTSLPFVDWLLVMSILGTVAIAGFLPGVAVGVLLAVLIFIVSYSRQGAVRHEFTGATYRSKVDRGTRAESYLSVAGEVILILDLQGYLFFGTAAELVDRVQRRTLDASVPQLQFLVLDFRRVTGIDSSTVQAFQRIDRLARTGDFVLVWSGLSDRTRRQLGSLVSSEQLVQASRDRAVELCEELLLSRAGLEEEETYRPQDGEVDLIGLIGDVAERREVRAETLLIEQGQPSREVIVIESGRMTVRLRAANGGEVRLRTLGPGAVVGEIGTYLGTPAYAEVVTDTDCMIRVLTADRIRELERDDPALASQLHRLIVERLARRLSQTNQALDDALG
jgi:SulP family sulfate permease